MQAFTRLAGVAAPLMLDNINTDVIIPVPWTKAFGISLASGLFGRWRYLQPELVNPADNPGHVPEDDPKFVLNRPEYRDTVILVTGKNFGCGSSREQAVWALMEYGIRCVIAESFGDIFFNNCFKNGLLPLVLPAQQMQRLAAEVEAAAGSSPMTVDLQECSVETPARREVRFTIDSARRAALLEGLDFIGLTLKHEEEIRAFQARDRERRPWIYDQSSGPAATGS